MGACLTVTDGCTADLSWSWLDWLQSAQPPDVMQGCGQWIGLDCGALWAAQGPAESSAALGPAHLDALLPRTLAQCMNLGCLVRSRP